MSASDPDGDQTPPGGCSAAMLRIEPAGLAVPLGAGASLLEAAQAAGIRLRSSCRNGTCRECRAQLLSGRVAHRIPWPGLSAEEKAQGWILPCVAVAELPLADVILLQPLRN